MKTLIAVGHREPGRPLVMVGFNPLPDQPRQEPENDCDANCDDCPDNKICHPGKTILKI